MHIYKVDILHIWNLIVQSEVNTHVDIAWIDNGVCVCLSVTLFLLEFTPIIINV